MGGYPNSCLVYNRKSNLEMDDDWGYPVMTQETTICPPIHLPQYFLSPWNSHSFLQEIAWAIEGNFNTYVRKTGALESGR